VRFGLPNRPPRLTEVAVVIAAMAAVTMVFAWQRKHDGNNNAAAPVTTVTAPAVPVITQVLPGGVVATQPLVSFRVYVGCGETPDEVRVAGQMMQMPISLFDRNPIDVVVLAEGVSAVVTVRADDHNSLQVLAGEAKAFYTALYVTVGERTIC